VSLFSAKRIENLVCFVSINVLSNPSYWDMSKCSEHWREVLHHFDCISFHARAVTSAFSFCSLLSLLTYTSTHA
jgi:hypothetical protein